MKLTVHLDENRTEEIVGYAIIWLTVYIIAKTTGKKLTKQL